MPDLSQSAVRDLAKRERRLARGARPRLWYYLFGWCANPLCRRYGYRPNLRCLVGKHKFIRNGRGSTYALIKREEGR